MLSSVGLSYLKRLIWKFRNNYMYFKIFHTTLCIIINDFFCYAICLAVF